MVRPTPDQLERGQALAAAQWERECARAFEMAEAAGLGVADEERNAYIESVGLANADFLAARGALAALGPDADPAGPQWEDRVKAEQATYQRSRAEADNRRRRAEELLATLQPRPASGRRRLPAEIRQFPSHRVGAPVTRTWRDGEPVVRLRGPEAGR